MPAICRGYKGRNYRGQGRQGNPVAQPRHTHRQAWAGQRAHHSHARTHHTGTGAEGGAHSHSTAAKAQRQGYTGAGHTPRTRGEKD